VNHSERRIGRRQVVAALMALPALPALAASLAAAMPVEAAGGERWVGTWACAPQLTEPNNMPPPPGLTGNTLRQVLHASIAGRRLRLRFSNEFGNSPVILQAGHIALSAGPGGAIHPETDRPLTFSGQSATTIAPGTLLWSDPLDFDLPAMADLAVSIHFGDTSPAVTGHPGSRTTSYIQPGDAVSAPTLTGATPFTHWCILDGVDVDAGRRRDAAAVAIVGDSITDGRGSTTDGNDRWPDALVRRLQGNPRLSDTAVLNLGIGGNNVLHDGLGPSAISRIDRDVLGQSGARWAIVFEGVNDIGGSPPGTADAVADRLIAAFTQIVAKAHAHGLKIYGATITPFGGSFYDRPGHEDARQKVNTWIRTSGTYDAVIDLDAAVCDPDNPTHLLSIADTGDHLHSTPEGYRRMAAAVDLSLFGK
jgi:lysophospholipase L1-like esterase